MPLSCEDTLSPGTIDDVQKAYGEDQEVPVQWELVTMNVDTQNCPINECKMYEVGCQIPLESPYLSFEGMNLLAVTNVTQGYSLRICLNCSNGADNMTFDNWKLSVS